MENPINPWMIWGVLSHYFRKIPKETQLRPAGELITAALLGAWKGGCRHVRTQGMATVVTYHLEREGKNSDDFASLCYLHCWI